MRAGAAITALRCEDLDLTALDPSHRLALTAATGRLCRTLEGPLQLLVQVRTWVEPAALDSRAALAGEVTRAGEDNVTTAAEMRTAAATHLRAAEEAWLLDALISEPAFRRTVLVLTEEAAPGAPPRARDAAAAALAAAGVGCTAVTGIELATLLAEAWDGDTPADGRVQPPPWRMAPGSLRSGAVLLRGHRLDRLPGVALEAGWLAPLLRVRCECDIAIHLSPVPLGDAVARLTRRLRTLRADQLVDLDREGLGDAAVEAGVDGALELRERLARNEGAPVAMSVVAVARARDPETLTANAALLRAGFATAMAGSAATHLEHHEAALASWPLVAAWGRPKLVDSGAAATCAPFVEAVCCDPGGVVLGRARDTGTPVRLDLFDRSRHVNGNVAILAASGRGKSYAIGTLLLGAAARGIGAVVVDPEGEYGAVVAAAGGVNLALQPGGPTALNIFDVALGGDEADGGDATVGAVVGLVDCLLGGGLDDVERAAVDGAARGAITRGLAAGRAALVGDMLQELAVAAPRVAAVLRRYCGGPLGELFNRPTTATLDTVAAAGGMVCLSLRDLRDELVPATALLVAEWLWALVRRDRRPRHIVFDEVGLLCAHPALRALLTQLSRRCRKYGASLVVATQNAGDLLSTDEGRVVATNPATVLLGGHQGAETLLMSEAYALTAAQRAWLGGAARGEFLLLSGSRRLPVRIETSPLHHALLTGTAPGPEVRRR